MLLQRQVISERKKKRVIVYTLFFVALLYILVNLIGENGLLRYIELKDKKRAIEAEILALAEENRMLKNQIELLRDDPFYIEKKAREDLGLARPDEFIFEYDKNDNR